MESNKTLERATRECRISPTIATFSPDKSLPPIPKCFRIVNASNSAWLGCSCVPSPALTTLPDIHSESANRCAAPEAGCRITTASAPIAWSVIAVSLSDSPLLKLEPFAEKLITSAESRFAAASKEIRVRVESSANRFTIVRPRNVGSFFTAPSLTRANSVAVSRIEIASGLLRSEIDKRCFIILPPLQLLLHLDHQSHLGAL